ncbi:bifunctional methylenetetrahydrofolate dehydrogenase/methenyltetrahydrofolate cyclohydrolase FolD [Alicyclobacillus sp. SO9]|uniref:bifunctional methylenetetrahydrofolate dehydrogenase/methenyltetrahydrofolate cyclohydrolase FolD n=1 Tax=Alicyclobacillus sp. SO9 TaxID=2665646 RepID=UPI0018E88552|nr:bifunctional methylenetetrahydrofolate dehydrogenase/methenyltetrahydrofolate cyclohydrolase FolD [Alicyclobacillus sp. SO9]QQE76968.1 bifunctional methylenetetrahydrofolate dehydrogenase/methenyltetrahydrofolate cyclohydrolase FolD [Alicyclobacillus sp. SO9]
MERRETSVATILDGKEIAGLIREEAKSDLDVLDQHGIKLKLTVVLVGDDPASATYVRSKERVAGEVGLDSEIIRLQSDTTQAELLGIVDRLNQDDSVDGILVQLPLPKHIDEDAVLDKISPEKDVDGFHPISVGRNVSGMKGAVWPCTPAGIMKMLRLKGIETEGRHAVVVGRSNIVGKPMAMLLLEANATVSMCHSRTKDLAAITKQADILVVAVGRANMITSEHVKQGAVVIDVGMNRVDGKLTGDVDFASVEPVASAITPVPGGVGRLTVATLMLNTLKLGATRRKQYELIQR